MIEGNPVNKADFLTDMIDDFAEWTSPSYPPCAFQLCLYKLTRTQELFHHKSLLNQMHIEAATTVPGPICPPTPARQDEIYIQKHVEKARESLVLASLLDDMKLSNLVRTKTFAFFTLAISVAERIVPATQGNSIWELAIVNCWTGHAERFNCRRAISKFNDGWFYSTPLDQRWLSRKGGRIDICYPHRRPDFLCKSPAVMVSEALDYVKSQMKGTKAESAVILLWPTSLHYTACLADLFVLNTDMHELYKHQHIYLANLFSFFKYAGIPHDLSAFDPLLRTASINRLQDVDQRDALGKAKLMDKLFRRAKENFSPKDSDAEFGFISDAKPLSLPAFCASSLATTMRCAAEDDSHAILKPKETIQSCINRLSLDRTVRKFTFRLGYYLNRPSIRFWLLTFLDAPFLKLINAVRNAHDPHYDWSDRHRNTNMLNLVQANYVGRSNAKRQRKEEEDEVVPKVETSQFEITQLSAGNATEVMARFYEKFADGLLKEQCQFNMLATHKVSGTKYALIPLPPRARAGPHAGRRKVQGP